MEEFSGLLGQSKDLYNYLVREIEEADTTASEGGWGINQTLKHYNRLLLARRKVLGDSGNKVLTCSYYFCLFCVLIATRACSSKESTLLVQIMQNNWKLENAIIFVILGCSGVCLTFLGPKIRSPVSSLAFVPCRKNFIITCWNIDSKPWGNSVTPQLDL